MTREQIEKAWEEHTLCNPSMMDELSLNEKGGSGMSAVIMAEEYWANSPLSIARYYGGIKVNGDEYKIVNKDGITLEELSDPSSKHYVKEGKAIPAGEPADLVRKDWIPIYRKLGRDRTIGLVKNGTSLKEAKKIAKEETK